MKTILTTLMIIGILGMGHSAFATSKVVSQEPVVQKNVVSPDKMETIEYQGIINRTSKGYTLLAEEKTYLLIGKNLKDLVGKTVSISGQLLMGEKPNTIFVAKAVPAQ